MTTTFFIGMAIAYWMCATITCIMIGRQDSNITLTDLIMVALLGWIFIPLVVWDRFNIGNIVVISKRRASKS